MGKFDYSIPVSINLPKLTFDAKDSKALRKKANSALVASNIRGMSEVEKQLGVALDNSINSLWAWNRNVVWRDGTVPGNPRDIVYTGKLRESRKLTTKFLKTKSNLTIAYTAPYAAFMYYGGVMQPYGNKNAPSVIIPGRPWIEAIMNGTHGQPKFDFIGIFNDAWNDEFQKRIS